MTPYTLEIQESDLENGALLEQIKTLHADVGEIKGALGKLTEAITKLALIEDRQTRSSECLDRAFRSIDRLSERIASLEQQLPAIANQTSANNVWVDRALWAVLSGSVVYMMKAAGIL